MSRSARTHQTLATIQRPQALVASPHRADHLQAFLASAQGDRLAALWILAATTGMRRAELLGVGWDAVDLDAGRLEVRRTVVLVEGRPVLVDATKTAHGRRGFALDPATVAALKTHRTRQLAERLAWARAGPIPAWCSPARTAA